MLHEQQSRIFELVKNRRVRFLRVDGSAGTGKSYLIEQVREYDNAVCITAPSARAASNVQGETLHRMFGIPSKEPLNPDERVTVLRAREIETRFLGKRRDPLLRRISWIVLDEYTMIRCDHIDFIDKAMRRATGNPEPFGGKHVMFVGGPGQLMPVADENDTKALLSYGYELPFGLEQSKFWKEHEKSVQICHLNHIFRQENPIEARILDRIKVGKQTDKDLRDINEMCVRPKHPEAMTLAPHRSTVKAINDRELNGLRTREYVFECTRKGKMEAGNMQEVLRLREGCRVVSRKNVRKKIKGMTQYVMNGDTGMFMGLDKYDRLKVMRDREDDYVYISPEKEVKYMQVEDEDGGMKPKEVAWIRQYPVQLGYALTVNSAQGLTIPRVHFELPYKRLGGWAGIVYVAISRVPSFSRLSLNRPLTHADVSSTIERVDEPMQQDSLNV